MLLSGKLVSYCNTCHCSKAASRPPACKLCAPKQPPRHRKLQLLAKQSLDYKQAGVDIDAGAELVKRIQKLNPSIGGFSGLVPFGEE